MHNTASIRSAISLVLHWLGHVPHEGRKFHEPAVQGDTATGCIKRNERKKQSSKTSLIYSRVIIIIIIIIIIVIIIIIIKYLPMSFCITACVDIYVPDFIFNYTLCPENSSNFWKQNLLLVCF